MIIKKPSEVIDMFKSNYDELSSQYRNLHNSYDKATDYLVNAEAWNCLFASEIERIANVHDGAFSLQQCLDYLKSIKAK